MEMALASLPKSELIALLERERRAVSERDLIIGQRDEKITHLAQERDYLKAQVEMLKRMQFGQKRERFEGDSSQIALPFEPTAQEKQQQEATTEEQITYTRKKTSAHKGRAALPDHLPVEEVEIYPEGDLSDMICIGKDVTEELSASRPGSSSNDIFATNMRQRTAKGSTPAICPNG